MTRRPSPLDEPIEIKRFWKNRQREIAVVVSLSSYEGHNLISVREYFTDATGCMKPSQKGVSLVIGRLPELAAGVAKALEKARELGLIDDARAEA